MPLCYCFTSLKESEVPKGFECELSNLVADILKKPPEVTFFLRCSWVELFYETPVQLIAPPMFLS